MLEYNYVDTEPGTYKWFYPPAERIRKLKIKLRNHDGTIIDIGDKSFSLLFEFVILLPQQLRKFIDKDTGFARVIS
jgi:hypothetical protein